MASRFARVRSVRYALTCSLVLSCCAAVRQPPAVRGPSLDERVEALRVKAGVPGLALGVIEDGLVVEVKAFGVREVASGAPLRTDTVMYAASWTKFAFATVVLELVEEGRLELDRPISGYLPRPLPGYEKYAELANDERWQALTPRMLLSHTGGFPNFRQFNEDGKLDFKANPGTRYAYSGEGINLLQFVLENGLGLDVGALLGARFSALGMGRSSMTWREDFEQQVATGYTVTGAPVPHTQRRSVRAAGSLDSTIADFATFLAAFMRGDGLSAASRRALLTPQIAITSAHQFPTFERVPGRALGLSSGLGVVLFEGPQGPGFFKGGHDDGTDNTLVCLERGRRCVLLMSNSNRAPAIYPAVVRAVLGETGLPWSWEYSGPDTPAAIE
jgi:CubicO group peptidase (beta-lactamase class C family)